MGLAAFAKVHSIMKMKGSGRSGRNIRCEFEEVFFAVKEVKSIGLLRVREERPELWPVGSPGEWDIIHLFVRHPVVRNLLLRNMVQMAG